MAQQRPADPKDLISMAEMNQEYMLRYAVLMAEQKRTFYMACLNEGFNEHQAMQLTARYPQ